MNIESSYKKRKAIRFPPEAWLLLWNEYAKVTHNYAFATNYSSKRDKDGNQWYVKSDKHEQTILLICDEKKAEVEKAQVAVDSLEKEIETLVGNLKKVETHIEIFSGQDAILKGYEEEKKSIEEALKKRVISFKEEYNKLRKGERRYYKIHMKSFENLKIEDEDIEVSSHPIPMRMPSPLPEKAEQISKEEEVIFDNGQAMP